MNTLKNAVIGCQKMMVTMVRTVQPTRRRRLLRQRRGCRQFSLMEIRQTFNLRLRVVTSYLGAVRSYLIITTILRPHNLSVRVRNSVR